MPFMVLLGNQSVEEPEVSTFREFHQVKHIDDLLELLKLQNRYRHVYVSNNANPAEIKKAATSRLHMHYKPSCPYTRKALYMIERFQTPVVVAMHNAEHPDRREKLAAYLQHTKGFDGSGRLTFPQFFSRGQPLGGTDTFADHVDVIVKKVSGAQADDEAAELVRTINGGWGAGGLVAPPRIPYFDTTKPPLDAATGVAGADYDIAKLTTVNDEEVEIATNMQTFMNIAIRGLYPAARAGKTPDAALGELIGAGKVLTDNVPTFQNAVLAAFGHMLQFNFLPFKVTAPAAVPPTITYAANLATINWGFAERDAEAIRVREDAFKAAARAFVSTPGLPAAKLAAAERAARIHIVSGMMDVFKAANTGIAANYAVVGNFTDVRTATTDGANGDIGAGGDAIAAMLTGGAGAAPAAPAAGGRNLDTAELEAVYNAVVAKQANIAGKSLREAAEVLYDDVVAIAGAGVTSDDIKKRSYALLQALYFALLAKKGTSTLVSFGRSRKARKASFGARRKSRRRMNSFGKKKRKSNKKKASFGRKRKTSIKKSRKTRGRNA
jgi:glutaredoxin